MISYISPEKKQLIDELVREYGIEPDDVIFFNDDPKPFFSYEATCAMANHLTDIQEIEIEPIECAFTDSISLRCSLVLPDGRRRSAVGVANRSEQIDGAPATPQQTYQLASSRAIRNALRAAGIDLYRLHRARHHNAAVATQSSDAIEFQLRKTLLAQVHLLGQELGLISKAPAGYNKTAWVRMLHERYGTDSAQYLSNDSLADLAAYLRSLRNVSPDEI
jgi:hypothetical protein